MPPSFGPLTEAHPNYCSITKHTAERQVADNIRAYLNIHGVPKPAKKPPHIANHIDHGPFLCLGNGAKLEDAGHWYQTCKTCKHTGFITLPLDTTVLAGLEGLFAIRNEIAAYTPRSNRIMQQPLPCRTSSASTLLIASSSPQPALPAPFSPLPPSSEPSSSTPSSPCKRLPHRGRRLSPPGPQASSSRTSLSKRTLSPDADLPITPAKRFKPAEADRASVPIYRHPIPTAAPRLAPPTPEAIDEGSLFNLTLPVVVIIHFEDNKQVEEVLFPRHDSRVCFADFKTLLGTHEFEQGNAIEYFSYSTEEWTPCSWATRHLISGEGHILQFRYA